VSGIGVIRWPSEIVDRTTVECLVSNLEERGPDGTQVRSETGVALVHARSITTPEARLEEQPQRHVRQEWWVTADARLDHRDELRSALRSTVEQPLRTDADLILAAYERWGPALCEHLVGDFAFVIWDAHSRRLTLGRDHFGIRPLFWTETEGRVVAASTVRATLESSGRPQIPDLIGLAEQARFDVTDPTRTCWAGIHRLPPAHVLVIDETGSRRPTRYWSPQVELRDRSLADAADEVRDRFDAAVRERLRTTAKHVGVQLSGGFDSTSVAATARLHDEGLTAYSVAFPGLACDESDLVDAVVADAGILLERIDATSVAPFDFLGYSASAWQLPPLPDHEWYGPLLARAGAQGRRVVLTGQGGDAALYGAFDSVAADAAGRLRWLAAARALSAGGRRGPGLPRALARAALVGASTRHPDSPLAGWWCARRSSRDTTLADHHLPPALRALQAPRSQSGLPAPRSVFAAARQAPYTGTDVWFAELWDRTAAAHGIELRHPFLDVHLVESILSVPPRVLLAGGSHRGLHIAAFEDRLPSAVTRRRGKAEFSEPWSQRGRRVVRDLLDRSVGAGALVSEDHLRSLDLPHEEISATGGSFWSWWGAVSVAVWERAAYSGLPMDASDGRSSYR
jgi:asparagine synthase (glutamine-hydrolysing)